MIESIDWPSFGYGGGALVVSVYAGVAIRRLRPVDRLRALCAFFSIRAELYRRIGVVVRQHQEELAHEIEIRDKAIVALADELFSTREALDSSREAHDILERRVERLSKQDDLWVMYKQWQAQLPKSPKRNLMKGNWD